VQRLQASPKSIALIHLFEVINKQNWGINYCPQHMKQRSTEHIGVNCPGFQAGDQRVAHSLPGQLVLLINVEQQPWPGIGHWLISSE
jgi:hypothetical protein